MLLAYLINVVIVDVTLIEVDIIVHILASLFVDLGCELTVKPRQQYNIRLYTVQTNRHQQHTYSKRADRGKISSLHVFLQVNLHRQVSNLISTKSKAA